MTREKIVEGEKVYIQIPYYREGGKTTIFPEYEMNVLENIQIEGVSKPIKRTIKGEVYFWFSVTSYITIKEKFQREYLDKESFCQFFEELLQVYEKIQIYLLDRKLVCLEPEYIFYDEKEKNYVFLAVGEEQKQILDCYEELFIFFADICSVEEKKLLEFLFETFTDLNRNTFDEMQFLKNIVKYKYEKEMEEIKEIDDIKTFEEEDTYEEEELPKMKGTMIIGIVLLFLSFWFSFMCEEEFRYAVAGMAACLLAICLLGYEVVKKVMDVIKKKSVEG